MIGCGGQSPRERAPRLPPHPLLHVRTYKKVPRTRNLTLPWPQVCLDPGIPASGPWGTDSAVCKPPICGDVWPPRELTQTESSERTVKAGGGEECGGRVAVSRAFPGQGGGDGCLVCVRTCM